MDTIDWKVIPLMSARDAETRASWGVNLLQVVAYTTDKDGVRLRMSNGDEYIATEMDDQHFEALCAKGNVLAV